MHLVQPFLQKFEDLFDFAFTSAALNNFMLLINHSTSMHPNSFALTQNFPERV